MSLRQREWAIYTRSYRMVSGSRVYDSGDRVYGNYPGYGMTSGQGDGEGGSGGSAKVDSGAWVMWYKGSSFKELREKYKELLNLTTQENIRVAEIVNVDTMITPIS